MDDKLKADLKAELIAELKKASERIFISCGIVHRKTDIDRLVDLHLSLLSMELLPVWTDHKAMEALREGKAFFSIISSNGGIRTWSAYETDGMPPIQGDPADEILAVCEKG